jgi:hypothetical protein
VLSLLLLSVPRAQVSSKHMRSTFYVRLIALHSISIPLYHTS